MVYYQIFPKIQCRRYFCFHYLVCNESDLMDTNWNVGSSFSIQFKPFFIYFFCSTTFFSVVFATANSLRLQRELTFVHLIPLLISQILQITSHAPSATTSHPKPVLLSSSNLPSYPNGKTHESHLKTSTFPDDPTGRRLLQSHGKLQSIWLLLATTLAIIPHTTALVKTTMNPTLLIYMTRILILQCST